MNLVYNYNNNDSFHTSCDTSKTIQQRKYNDPVSSTEQVYHNLGVKEVEDQLAVINYMKKNLHFIDTSRIAMWGWKYGAFVTLMAMARDADSLIKCGIAVAPITRWEHYGELRHQS